MLKLTAVSTPDSSPSVSWVHHGKGFKVVHQCRQLAKVERSTLRYHRCKITPYIAKKKNNLNLPQPYNIKLITQKDWAA